jgi:hypothetical protein
MDRTTATAVEILTWVNKRLTEYPACSGFILDAVLQRLDPATSGKPNWELGLMRGDVGPPSHDCLDCLTLVVREAQLRFSLE